MHSRQVDTDAFISMMSADHFFWAVVELPDHHADIRRIMKPSSRWIHEELLQSVMLPSLDSLVWTVCEASPRSTAESSKRRLLFCIQDRQRAIEVWSSGAIHYGPDSVPESLELLNSPSSINLLCGNLTPSPIARARAQRWLTIGVLGVAVAASFLFGVERRLRAEAASYDARQSKLTAVLNENRASAVAELTARRDLLRITRQRLDRAGAHHKDAAAAMADLLVAWPKGDAGPIVQTDSLSASSDAIVLQASFFDRQDALSLAEALARFPARSGSDTPGGSWLLGQPQISSSGGPEGQPSIRAAFRFSRTPDELTLSRDESQP